MSYTALYRKFRPDNFTDVKGQDHIVTTLTNQIRHNRIGHAYLFCGTRGTGKTTVAKILAKAVNCEEEVSYRPTEGKYKVYIIDEVHMLSTGAFNALLKTLEEPPSYVMFILATTEAHKIPITILSRCQRYDFHRITIDTIAARLEELLKIEGVEAEEKAIRYVAKAEMDPCEMPSACWISALPFIWARLSLMIKCLKSWVRWIQRYSVSFCEK